MDTVAERASQAMGALADKLAKLEKDVASQLGQREQWAVELGLPLERCGEALGALEVPEHLKGCLFVCSAFISRHSYANNGSINSGPWGLAKDIQETMEYDADWPEELGHFSRTARSHASTIEFAEREHTRPACDISSSGPSGGTSTVPVRSATKEELAHRDAIAKTPQDDLQALLQQRCAVAKRKRT